MTPEERDRQQIDLLLQQCGWIIQDRSQTNLTAGPGVAIREALLRRRKWQRLSFTEGYKKHVQLSRDIPARRNPPIDRNGMVERRLI